MANKYETTSEIIVALQLLNQALQEAGIQQSVSISWYKGKIVSADVLNVPAVPAPSYPKQFEKKKYIDFVQSLMYNHYAKVSSHENWHFDYDDFGATL